MKGTRCMKRQTLTVLPITPSMTTQPNAAPTPAFGDLAGIRRASAAPVEAKPQP